MGPMDAGKVSHIDLKHIHLNQNHPATVIRMRVDVDCLKPKSTYYYTVDSMQGNGKSDGVKCPIRRFPTP